MTAPLLSIITVHWNDAEGLARTVASLRQTEGHAEVECVLVDGGSPDSALTSARTFYLPERLISEPDRGIYEAMNKGLRRARGRYCLWVNAGDELLPGVLPGLLAHLAASSADLVSGGTRIASLDGAFPTYLWCGDARGFAHGALPHPSTCIAREAAIALGGYDERYPIAADRDLMIRLHRRGATFQAIDTTIAGFTTGGVSSTPRAWLEDIRLQRAHDLIGPVEAGIRRLKYLVLLLPGVAPGLHARSHRRAGRNSAVYGTVA
jgi:glycosyltransferase involved in cell wall biosynthesis